MISGSEIYSQNPLLSGVNAPENSLTMDGPATEPIGVNALPDPNAEKRKQLAMAMMGQQLQKIGSQGYQAPTMHQSATDMYGQLI